MNPTDTIHCNQQQQHNEGDNSQSSGPITNGVMNGNGGELGGFGSLGGTPTKSALPLESASSLFAYTPFGTTPNSNKPFEGSKRTSIDESWVNVEWNEVKKATTTSSPQGSPMKEDPSVGEKRPEESRTNDHPMASVPMAPSEMERDPAKTHFGGIVSGLAHSTLAKPEISKPSSLFGLTGSMNGSPQKNFDSFNAKPATPIKEEATPAPSVPPTITQAKHESHTPLFATSEAKPLSNKIESFSTKLEHTPKPVEGEKSFTSSTGYTHTPLKNSTANEHADKLKSNVETPKPATIPSHLPTPAKVETPKMMERKETLAATPKTEEASKSTPKSTPRAPRTPRSKPDTPVTPRSSGRQRKTVDRLSPISVERPDSKTIEIPSGSGASFSDIPHISKELAKRKSDFTPLITVHRIIFGRPGEAAKRKGYLRQFHGFAEEEDMHKASEKLAHHTIDDLKDICVFLNLERAGDRKNLSDRIARYLMKPTDLGESKPAPRRTPQKRSKSSPSKKGRPKVSKKVSGDANNSQEEGDDGEEETRDSASEGDEHVIADLAADQE